MSWFYVVYTVNSSLPGGGENAPTYQIYDSENEFLSDLDGFIQYAAECILEQDVDYFERNPDEKEQYDDYMEKINERYQDNSSDNGLYEEPFSALDIEIEISVATSDITLFAAAVLEGYLQAVGVDDVRDLEPEERAELFKEYSMVRYLEKLKASGRKPDPKTFKEKFYEYVDILNTDNLLLF